MQSGEREGMSAHGCGGAAGQGVQEQTDLDALQERVFEHMRLLAEQHAEQVRVLTAEVAALRQQVAELAERSQQDTSNEANRMLVRLLEDARKDIRAEAQDAQRGGAAVGNASIEAQDGRAEAAGTGPRKSMRIERGVKQAYGACGFADNWCEARKVSGVVAVAGARDMPEQGCFCAKGCAGQGGECTNQVPPIETGDNVEVLESYTVYGKCLIAKRAIAAGEILTVFGGVVVKKLAHTDAYKLFSLLHTVQQQTAKGEKKFEYSAQTGSNEMPDSQAWVIPPEDIPLLQEGITYWKETRSKLNTLVKQHKTRPQDLGQFAQHTCCAKHVNAYFFPICIMHRQQQGGKRRQDEESMDVQALAIRAQKAIQKGDEILVHYVGAGKMGDLWFDCRCCKCMKEEGCAA